MQHGLPLSWVSVLPAWPSRERRSGANTLPLERGRPNVVLTRRPRQSPPSKSWATVSVRSLRDPSRSAQNKVLERDVTDHRWDKTEPVTLTVMFTFTGTVNDKLY